MSKSNLTNSERDLRRVSPHDVDEAAQNCGFANRRAWSILRAADPADQAAKKD
jgi:hypothetical protein